MVGTGHIPISMMRHPLESKPAMTACLTISPEVRGSRPMTTVRWPTYVPNACAKRVSSVGVRDSPMTPRTPEILILRDGIGRIDSDTQPYQRTLKRTSRDRIYKIHMIQQKAVPHLVNLVNHVNAYSICRAPNQAGGEPSSHPRLRQ